MYQETKLERTTRVIELVETGNISRSLKRIMNGPNYNRARWKRSIVNAMAIAGCYDSEIEAVRKALQLP